MIQTTAREALKVEVASLPEDLAAEVLDFIEFMRHRRAEEDYLWQQAAAAEVRMANRPGEVQTVTRTEWEALPESRGT